MIKKNYCCLISNQLDLTSQSSEIENSYQLNTFFTKLAIDLLRAIKKQTKLCALCENFLKNLKHFSKRETEVQKAKSLLTHQDLIEEIVKRIEKGAMPASDSLWTNLLYLYSKREGFNIPDKFFSARNKKTTLQEFDNYE